MLDSIFYIYHMTLRLLWNLIQNYLLYDNTSGSDIIRDYLTAFWLSPDVSTTKTPLSAWVSLMADKGLGLILMKLADLDLQWFLK